MENKKYIVRGRLLLLGGFKLPFQMEYEHEDDIPDWAKDLGWNFEKPLMDLITLTDKDYNDWTIEREKILGWGVDVDEIKQNEKTK